MTRQTIDEYLDGALDAAAKSEVEMMVARDADAGRMMAQSKAERALRTAVYASYAPSKQEASSFAAQVLAACEDEALEPVGSIGVWTWARRLTSIAAAIAVMAGVFLAGRMTAPATVVVKPGEETIRMIHTVAYENAAGQIELREGMTAEERSAYLKELEEHGPSGFALSDLATPGEI